MSDFGTSKRLSDISSEILKRHGTIRYSDPRFLRDPQNYSRNKKSDVYSVGVLLWEISSSCTPFSNTQYTPHDLSHSIIYDNLREKVVNGTPKKYAVIYKGIYLCLFN